LKIYLATEFLRKKKVYVERPNLLRSERAAVEVASLSFWPVWR